MATIRQMEANKLNAQKSTGPKTEAGKAASSQNRLVHGFASRNFLLPDEDPAEFAALHEDFVAEYQPATVTEQVLVEKMATNHWLTLRAFCLQGEAFREEAQRTGKVGIPKTLGLLIRYYTTAERAFHRAHTELVKTQKERKKSEIGFEPQKACEAPGATRPDRSRRSPWNTKSTRISPS